MIVVASWTPQGFFGQLIGALGRRLPPPPAGAAPPILWGTEAHVRTVLGGQILLALERRTVDLVFSSSAEMMAGFQERFGPMILARQLLDPESYEVLVAELRALCEASAIAGPQSEVRIPSEYLLVVGLKP